MKTFHVEQIEDWDSLARAVARSLRPGMIVTLSGQLGAGKTTFVQFLARVLGVREIPRSPTFSLVRTYRLKSKLHGLSRLVHVDAYRLEKSADALALGLDEALAEPGAVMCIEWPEHLAEWLAHQSNSHINIAIAIEQDGTRRVTLFS